VDYLVIHQDRDLYDTPVMEVMSEDDLLARLDKKEYGENPILDKWPEMDLTDGNLKKDCILILPWAPVTPHSIEMEEVIKVKRWAFDAG
jgi:hypothetical protein